MAVVAFEVVLHQAEVDLRSGHVRIVFSERMHEV